MKRFVAICVAVIAMACFVPAQSADACSFKPLARVKGAVAKAGGFAVRGVRKAGRFVVRGRQG